MNSVQRLLEYKRLALLILYADDPCAVDSLRVMCDEDLDLASSWPETEAEWLQRRAFQIVRVIAEFLMPREDGNEQEHRECAASVLEWVGFFEACRRVA